MLLQYFRANLGLYYDLCEKNGAKVARYGTPKLVRKLYKFFIRLFLFIYL